TNLPVGLNLLQNNATLGEILPSASLEFTAFSLQAGVLTEDTTWSTNLLVQANGLSFIREIPLTMKIERNKSFFGKVKDLDTGLAISGATITANGTSSNFQATTDADGNYQ